MNLMTVIVNVPLATLLSGCALVGSEAWFGSEREGESALVERAAFDLECESEDLSIICLSTCKTVGVTGCGKKATYVFVNRRWLMNTESTP